MEISPIKLKHFRNKIYLLDYTITATNATYYLCDLL